jgi:hypothetical protein
MISMAWRQHRLQIAGAAVVVAALIGYFAVGAIQRAQYADSIGLSACLGTPGANCGSLAQAFFHRFGGLSSASALLAVVPMLAGVFIGAPLIAREVETGTHRLAWTQSVPRRRWLAVKIVMLLSAVLLGAVLLSLAYSWWISVLDRASQAGYTDVNRLNPGAFDLTGLAPVGAALFAFALGTAAGALIRRSVPAMAVTVVWYLAVALPLESLRYHILAPLTVSGAFGTTPVVEPGAYAMSTGYADATGRSVDFTALIQACGQQRDGNSIGVTPTCLAEKGFQFTQLYQPGSRYWPLQWIEFGVFGVAAVLLLAVAMWWTTRHIN